MKDTIKNIEEHRSKTNWVEELITQILFDKHLSETMESLDPRGIGYILFLSEQIQIRQSVQESWDKSNQNT